MNEQKLKNMYIQKKHKVDKSKKSMHVPIYQVQLWYEIALKTYTIYL